jgi:hypothetical protein
MSKLKDVSESTPSNVHSQMWDEAISEYGDQFKVPAPVVYEINDRYRALHALLKWKKEGALGNPIKYLHQYSIMESNLIAVARDYCNIEIDEEKIAEEVKTEKRADKYDSFIEWSKAHLFEQFTTDQLVAQAGFSYQTTLKFIQESPHFRKVKKGLWEVRDPKADKEAGI